MRGRKFQGLSLDHIYEKSHHSNQCGHSTNYWIYPSQWAIQPSDCYVVLDGYMTIAPTLLLTAEHYHLVSIILGPPLLSVNKFCSSISFCQPWPGEDDHPSSWCRARNRTWESDLCLLNYYLLTFADASLCPACVGYCSEKATACPKGRVWNINPQLFHK